MAHSSNITYTFVNNLAYDMVTDGIWHPWGSSNSGGFASSPTIRIGAFQTGKAFEAWGANGAATGVTGAVNYWFVSTGSALGPNKSNAKGSLQLYFSIPYDHTLFSNAQSAHLNLPSSQAMMLTDGWNSNSSVSLVMTFAPPPVA
jgi:hypothetical protein